MPLLTSHRQVWPRRTQIKAPHPSSPPAHVAIHRFDGKANAKHFGYLGYQGSSLRSSALRRRDLGLWSTVSQASVRQWTQRHALCRVEQSFRRSVPFLYHFLLTFIIFRQDYWASTCTIHRFKLSSILCTIFGQCSPRLVILHS